MSKSGHARLKAALVLRDALADSLGLPLGPAARHAAEAETLHGATRALDEGKYLVSLVSVCKKNDHILAFLDQKIRTACAKARFSPRYAQYLALLFFASWLDAQEKDETAFLDGLNAYLDSLPAAQRKKIPVHPGRSAVRGVLDGHGCGENPCFACLSGPFGG
ncbi:hypothetical protein [Desulfonatronum thioautotrophicum]|uniref:hypothetical protein n=1 Tax=Desulfonatronum thioautotrophicum TaxID=617001 RepID=UPI0005EBED62|nr:hypothetical protein [Desulfonatronum thioautotrophicum]